MNPYISPVATDYRPHGSEDATVVDKFQLDRKGKVIILRMGRREVFHRNGEGNSQQMKQRQDVIASP